MTNKIKNLCVAMGMAASLALYAGLATGCAGDRYHRSTGAYVDDKTITTKVKTELYADPQVKGTQVKVKTYQGKVQLSGFVDTQAEKDRAAEIARRVQGVQWVKNDLVVKTATPGSVGTTASSTNRIEEPAGTQPQPSEPQPSQPQPSDTLP